MTSATKKVTQAAERAAVTSKFARQRTPSTVGTTPIDQHNIANRNIEPDDIHALGSSIFQFVGTSLEGGPCGIHPPTHIAALSAISGYASRMAVSLQIANGQAPDDFSRISVTRTTSVLASEQVNELVVAMDKPSVAGIVIGAALRCGLRQIPDLNSLLQSHLTDATLATQYQTGDSPDVPAETLLMMYWEPVARFFRASPGDFPCAPLAAAHAVGEAISVYRNTIPADRSLDLALRTAIAMSKVDRTF